VPEARRHLIDASILSYCSALLTAHLLLAACCLPLTYCPLPTAYYSLYTTLLATHHLLLTTLTHYSQLATCCLLLAHPYRRAMQSCKQRVGTSS